jgi:Spy/CpxP family protein refolding chaperone
MCSLKINSKKLIVIMLTTLISGVNASDYGEHNDIFLEIQSRLNLTEEQVQQFKPIFVDNFEKRRNLMNKYGINIDNQKITNNKGMGVMGIRQLRSLKKEIDKINKNAEKQLANIFTKEQMNIYKLFQEEQRDEMKEQLIGRKNS